MPPRHRAHCAIDRDSGTRGYFADEQSLPLSGAQSRDVLPPMNFSELSLKGNTRWVAAGGLLVGFAGLVLSETLLSPKYELLYSSGIGVAHCIDKEQQRSCSFSYEFSVGNTGKLGQDGLRIEWPLNLQRWGLQAQVADIVGSAKRTPQPQILGEFQADRTVYTINGLMPNTMVSIRGFCLACTPAQLQAMRHTQPQIASQGSVREGDPRLSALQRGAMNVLRLVGLFY